MPRGLRLAESAAETMLRPAGLAAQRLSHRLQVFRLQTPEGLTKTFLRWKSYKSGPQCLRKGDTPPYPFILSTERRSPGPGHGEAVGFLEEPPHARTRRAGAGTCRDMPGPGHRGRLGVGVQLCPGAGGFCMLTWQRPRIQGVKA